MRHSKGEQVVWPARLEGLVRARLQTVRAPQALRDRIRALLATEFRDGTSSDHEWRE
jgi:hypothetical protein